MTIASRMMNHTLNDLLRTIFFFFLAVLRHEEVPEPGIESMSQQQGEDQG